MTLMSYYTRSLNTHQENSRRETSQLYLDSAAEYISSTLSGNLKKAVEYTYHSSPIISLSLSTVNNHILGTTITRVRSDLQAAVSNAESFSSAVLYIPKAELCVSSSYEYGRLNELPARIYSLVNTYANSLTARHELQLNNETINYFHCDGNSYFAVELLTYNGEPQSILFIQLDTDSLYQNMAHIFSKNTDSLSMFVYDCFQNPLWENYAPYRADLAENDMLTSQSSWLAWTLYMPISTSTYTSMWYATHAPFVLLLVSALLIISLFVSAFMYRPVYRVSKALDEMDLPISADTMPDTEQNDDLSKSISRINAYQKELDAALQSVSEDVRTKLFLSLVECTPISYSTVEKTLQGIRSKFSVSGLYVSIAFLLENGEEVIDVAFSVAKDYLESYEKIHEFVACMPLKLSNKNEIAVILEFQDVDTAIVTGKKETMTLRNALSDLLNRRGFHVVLKMGIYTIL